MASGKPVSAIMTVEPVVANESTKFSQVLRLFTEYPVHHLPIVDNDNKLIGIVSSNDLPKVFLTLCHNNNNTAARMDLNAIDKEIAISDIMTRSPVTVTSTDSIGKAAQIMVERKFLSLPVVDNGELIGILTMKDIMANVADTI